MAQSNNDPVQRQIEDLQRYVQSQQELFLMQQKQASSLRQDLQTQLDRCLRHTSTVLRDNRNRQYVQKLIIAQQYAQLQAMQTSGQTDQAQLTVLQSMLDTILANQALLAGQVSSLNSQLQQQYQVQVPVTAAATPQQSPSSSSASLLAAALGADDDDNDNDDNNDGEEEKGDGLHAATTPAATTNDELLLKTLQSLQSSQDAMREVIAEKLPAQFRAGFDTMLSRLVACMEQPQPPLVANT